MAANEKAKFQYRVLKKYGVLPVFDGELDRKNVRSPLPEGETFSSWCERVIGKKTNDVMVYQLERPIGHKHIENMTEGGKELVALFRAHARQILRKNTKYSNIQSSDDEFEFDEFDEFELDEFSDLDSQLPEAPLNSQEPWYVILSNIKSPECLKCYEAKNYTLSQHGDPEEYFEEYGDAARHLIVLNDIAQYVEELGYVFSSGSMDRASEAADELVRFIESSSEIDALKAELNEAPESDRTRIEREHVKLYLGADLCHELYDMIGDMFLEFDDELENLTQAEEFIGNLLIGKSQSALVRCVDFLIEL